MIIENLFRDKLKLEDHCHNGQGSVLNHRFYDKNNSHYSVNFLDLVVIPPGASIGRHIHGNNIETYLILRGNGVMRLKNKDFPVASGDILVNPPYGEHGLSNGSEDELLLLVFEVSGG